MSRHILKVAMAGVTGFFVGGFLYHCNLDPAAFTVAIIAYSYCFAKVFF